MSEARQSSELDPGLLRSLVEGTATETGERFFAALVRALCSALGRHGAWITEYDPAARRLRALSFWLGDHWVEGYEYAVDGTPCAPVVDDRCLVHVPDRVVELYPGDPDLRSAGALSYLGVPLLGVDGAVLGHLAVLDTRPMPEEPRDMAVFRVFAARAAAELQRVHAEKSLRSREQQLSDLIATAMDGIVQLNPALTVVRANPAAERLFGTEGGGLAGADPGRFLTPASAEKLAALVGELHRERGRRQLWIPGGLRARRGAGEFQAEATLSRSDSGERTSFTLILRDVEERLEAERRLDALSAEARQLRAALDALGAGDEILGSSEAIRRVLSDVDEVALTDATVLVVGETGTGKELVARAVHARSRRRDRPLVCVNCAAIPASVVESELFGHEKGAFTGATARRAGRFEIADGGTLFLDEIGELPLELQPKLLRALQEGEIDPVGAAATRRVNVRVIAATNRDLAVQARSGRFREDLYYRLAVFPIAVPPLRDRVEDIEPLAQAFADRHARRMGRSVAPLSADDARRLRSYTWPGNVRELSNVIERAVITAREGRLNLDRALPEVAQRPDGGVVAGALGEGAGGRVLTEAEVAQLERSNLLRALEQASWRVAGPGGAAARLGMNPSTLSSRMRALGIRRGQA
jgi:PAS domain S-box-containing protein